MCFHSNGFRVIATQPQRAARTPFPAELDKNYNRSCSCALNHIRVRVTAGAACAPSHHVAYADSARR